MTRDSLLTLYSEKCGELATALDVSEDAMMKEIGLPFAPHRAGWKRVPPRWEDAQALSAGGGRLFKLETPPDATPFQYVDEGGLYHSFDLYARRDELEGWVITR